MMPPMPEYVPHCYPAPLFLSFILQPSQKLCESMNILKDIVQEISLILKMGHIAICCQQLGALADHRLTARPIS